MWSERIGVSPQPRIRVPPIARRRFFRPDQNFNRGPRINDQIRRTPIRLIDENNEMIGVVETPEAIRRAQEAGLDLVEVAADSDPPVCRILDYGKFKYEQSKKDRATKQRSKTTETKEVRLGRSMKIDPHDIGIRLNQARRFLMEGHKVQIVQNFRGREMIHRDRGLDRLNEIVEKLSDISRLEMPPRQNGRRMNMLLAPDRAKIEQIKRKLAKAAAAASPAPSAPPEDDAPPTDAGIDHVESPVEDDAPTSESGIDRVESPAEETSRVPE